MLGAPASCFLFLKHRVARAVEFMRTHSRWGQNFTWLSRNTPPLGCRILRWNLASHAMVWFRKMTYDCLYCKERHVLCEEWKPHYDCMLDRWKRQRRVSVRGGHARASTADQRKRRDLALRVAEWRTWTLQSANCCAQTKLVAVRKRWQSQTELENTSENREF